MSDIFLSYSTDDYARAGLVAKALEARGWSVWWDRKIPPGKSFAEVIEEHLDSARCVVTLWTPASVQSRWVLAESEEGARRGCLVPVVLASLDPSRNIPLAFRQIHAADLTDWQERDGHPGFESLLDAIESLLAAGTGVGVEDSGGKDTDNPGDSDSDSDSDSAPAPAPAPGKRMRRWTVPLLVLVAGIVIWWIVLNLDERHDDTATLVVDTEPPQALISLNGVERGHSPVTLDGLAAGEARVEATLKDHSPAGRSLSLSAGEHAAITLVLRPLPTSGALAIDSVPDGAAWSLDGKEQGQTPAKLSGIGVGSHRVGLSKAGYHAVDRPVTIRGGHLTRVKETLEPAGAQLIVRTEPSDARVQVMDVVDKYRAGMSLEPGSHRIRVTRAGYVPFDASRQLIAGEQTIKIRLEPVVKPTTKPVVAVPASPALTAAAPGLAFVQLPGDCFQMGSPENEDGRESDEKQHRVCVEPFMLSTSEVTNAQYRRFKPKHDSGEYEGHSLNGDDQQPVVEVSLEDALGYAAWLSQQTGQRFRLPTEAEWEYAARGGTDTARYWGDDPDRACVYANVADQSAKKVFSGWTLHDCDDRHVVTAPVSSYTANEFGLYDMLGNVWEWTCSAYKNPYDGAEKVCADETDTGARVIRGGSWFYVPAGVRSANRINWWPGYRRSWVGFRLAQDK